MKYYFKTQKYSICREEVYIQSQGVDKNGYVIPTSAFFVVYMSNNDMEDFYHIHITPESNLREIDLEEITKEQFYKVLNEGESFKSILLQNSEIAILESAKDKILQEVKRTFRPEFINRIDEIIVFHPLSEEHLRHIVKLMMNAVQKKMDNMNITIDISDKALEYLMKKGSDFEYGARPLKRVIQREIEDAVSELILEGTLQGKKVLHIDEKEEKLVFTAE